MATRKVMLKYPEHLIKEPVLFRMAKQFDVMPNIRRARVTETVGEIDSMGPFSSMHQRQVLAALQPLGWVDWTGAERGIFADALHGWKVTAQAVAIIETED